MLDRLLLVAVIALTCPGASFGQGYTGDLAIDPEDVKLGAKHYSPFVGQS